MTAAGNGAFRSLQVFNFRTWAIGALLSNVGTWMQRTAQDWLVLAELTERNATALGIALALQFGPQVFLLPLTGFAADHVDRRKLLIATQSAAGTLALGLGLLTVAGLVELWHVYVFALLLGCVSAFDAPARQTFASDLVPETLLSNAVALNASSFNAARTVGPALAGLLIASVGSGWVFIFNAGSFVAVIVSLCLLRVGELHPRERAAWAFGRLLQGFRYIWALPQLRTVFAMLLLIATFAFNFPIFIATMSVRVFHLGSREFGVLASTLAVGSVVGALLAARRSKPRASLLLVGALVFGVGLALAALMPNHILFGLMLMLIGLAGQTFNTTANASVQLATEPRMRGRVMAIFMTISLGSSLIGAPIVGLVADSYGPRWSLGVGAVACLAALLIGLGSLGRETSAGLRDS